MGTLKNNIGWCDVTMNPGIGCRGCELGDDCYAKFDSPARILRAGKWPGYVGQKTETFGRDRTFVPTKEGLSKLQRFNKVCICDDCRELNSWLDEDGRMKGYQCLACGSLNTLRRIRCFADSNSDWMDWPIDSLAKALDEIRRAPNVDVILLTKWPELWHERMEAIAATEGGILGFEPGFYNWLNAWIEDEPPANVITLTSVLGNAFDEKRIAGILQIPSRCRGLSMEPLWASVTLDQKWLQPDAIRWVIVGCDSSKHHKGWEDYAANARGIIQQCQAAKVPVYHKQMPVNGRVSLNPAGWPADLRGREWFTNPTN